MPELGNVETRYRVHSRTQRSDDFVPSEADLEMLVELMGVRYPVCSWANRFLQRAGKRGHDAVLFGMKHRSAKVRRACTDFLDHEVKRWDEATFRELESAIDDPTPRVRASVLHALGCQRCKEDALDDQAIDLYLHGMGDPSAKVRRTAVGGMWQFRRDPRVHDGLVGALEDESSRVRKTAAAALGSCVDNPRVPVALIDLLSREENPHVIRTTLTSLRQAAEKFVGQDRGDIEQELGAGVKPPMSDAGPQALFYPLSALVGEVSVEPDSRYWLRLIFNDSGVVRSTTTHDGIESF